MGPIDLGSPINWEHSLNMGRLFWAYVPKNQPSAGRTFIDLVGLSLRNLKNNGTLASSSVPTTSGPTAALSPNGDPALNFASASTQYVDFGTPASPLDTFHTGTFAIACWFNAASLSAAGQIIGRNDNNDSSAGWSLGYNSGLGYEQTRGSVNQKARFTFSSTSAWHHLLVNVTGTTGASVKFWLDGAPKSATSTSNGSGTQGSNTANPMQVGGNFNGTSNGIWGFWNGLIKDVSVWGPRTFTDGEAVELYELSQCGYPGVLNRAPSSIFLLGASAGSGGTIVFADCSAPAEHLVTAQRDSFNPEESLSTTQRDSFHPMERLLALQRDAVNPIEQLSTAQRDSLQPEEHLVALQKDSFGSEEYLASLVRDSFDPAEHLTVLQKDAVGPDEYLASTFKDAVTPEEHLAALSTDGFSPDEYTASTQVDLPLPEESLATATRDSTQPSERLADMTRDSVTPLEWGGAISVTVNAGCPVEWLTTVKTDTFVPMEWLSPTPAPVLVNAILVGGFSLVAPSISFSLVAPSISFSLVAPSLLASLE